MDAQLDRTVRAFVHRYERRLFDPELVDNWCRILTDALIQDLAATGRPAEMVWLRGHRVPVRRCPAGPGEGVHAVVLVDRTLLLDVSRRQYEPTARVPTVYRSRGEAAAHWEEIA